MEHLLSTILFRSPLSTSSHSDNSLFLAADKMAILPLSIIFIFLSIVLLLQARLYLFGFVALSETVFLFSFFARGAASVYTFSALIFLGVALLVTSLVETVRAGYGTD